MNDNINCSPFTMTTGYFHHRSILALSFTIDNFSFREIYNKLFQNSFLKIHFSSSCTHDVSFLPEYICIFINLNVNRCYLHTGTCEDKVRVTSLDHKAFSGHLAALVAALCLACWVTYSYKRNTIQMLGVTWTR